MNVEELFDHITKYMSAEQALKKLLEGTVINYEHLKFNEGQEIHPTMLIVMAAQEMGWDVAIPNSDDDELKGISVGSEDYLQELINDRKQEAIELLQYFVDRVEAGTIISKTTYKKYRDFLDKIK